MTETLILHFDQITPARLEHTTFEVVASDGVSRLKKAWREAEAHPREACFRWARGLMILCLVLLRIQIGGIQLDRRPLLTGRSGSAAATLDNMVHKADSMAWLRDMLTVRKEESARPRLLHWFVRKNSQRNNRELPIRIFAGTGAGALQAQNIRIHVAGERASGEQVAALEKNLALLLGELPWEVQGLLAVDESGQMSRIS